MDNVKYISEEDYAKINGRSKVDVGDVLMAMIGTIGNPIIIEHEPNFAIKNVALFKSKANQSSKYLKYYLQSPFVADKMGKEANGSTQRFVSLGYLRRFPFPDTALNEQDKVVKKLDRKLARVNRANELYIEKLAKIIELRQSVLAEAFTL